jgi:hypothetical protein
METEGDVAHPNCAACNDPGAEGFDWYDRTMWSIHLAIASDGWKGMYVSGGSVPAWGYTIGLSEGRDHPELVVVGLDVEVTSFVLHALASEVHAGVRFGPTGLDEYELAGVSMRFATVHPGHWMTERFAMWVNYYGDRGEPRPEPSAVQVLWPDGAGRHPGDRDFDPRARRRQPQLARAPRRSSVSRRRS